MADNLTDAEEARLIDLSLPPAGGVYLALFTAVGNDAGVGWVEVADGAYARQQLLSTAGSPKTGPTADILFPAASGAGYTVLGIGVFSALAAGTLRWIRSLTVGEQRTINTGDQYRVAANILTFSLS